jgi:hypothetical protein
MKRILLLLLVFGCSGITEWENHDNIKLMKNIPVILGHVEEGDLTATFKGTNGRDVLFQTDCQNVSTHGDKRLYLTFYSSHTFVYDFIAVDTNYVIIKGGFTP